MLSQRTLSALLGALLIVSIIMPAFMHGMDNPNNNQAQNSEAQVPAANAELREANQARLARGQARLSITENTRPEEVVYRAEQAERAVQAGVGSANDDEHTTTPVLKSSRKLKRERQSRINEIHALLGHSNPAQSAVLADVGSANDDEQTAEINTPPSYAELPAYDNPPAYIEHFLHDHPTDLALVRALNDNNQPEAMRLFNTHRQEYTDLFDEYRMESLRASIASNNLTQALNIIQNAFLERNNHRAINATIMQAVTAQNEKDNSVYQRAMAQERNEFAANMAHVMNEVELAQQERDRAQQERDRAQRNRGRAQQERDQAQQARDLAINNNRTLVQERDDALQERDQAQQERDVAHEDMAATLRYNRRWATGLSMAATGVLATTSYLMMRRTPTTPTTATFPFRLTLAATVVGTVTSTLNTLSLATSTKHLNNEQITTRNRISIACLFAPIATALITTPRLIKPALSYTYSTAKSCLWAALGGCAKIPGFINKALDQLMPITQA